MKKNLVAAALTGAMIMSMGVVGFAEDSENNDVKLGVQMFNFVVGGDWGQITSQEEVNDLLTAIADAGYDGVEWCNFQLGGDYIDLDETKKVMDDLGLETCGMHFHYGGADTLEEDAATVVERCQKLGTDSLIFAYSVPSTFGIEPDEDGNYTPEQVDEWVENIDTVIKALEKAAEGTGINVLYHNHATEMLEGTSGEHALDMIDVPGKEVDVYWTAKGLDGKVSSALDYVKEHVDSIHFLHIKDGLDGTLATGEMIGWGKGTFDIQSIVDVARSSSTINWVIVENDAPNNSGLTGLEDAQQSAAWARANIDFSRTADTAEATTE